jgi:hypothetical protein
MESHMTEPKIKRKSRSFTLALRTTEAASSVIRFDDVAGGLVELGAGGTAVTSLEVWASDTPTSAFGRVFKDGTAVSIPLSQDAAVPRVYPLPDETYAAGAIKLVANNAAATGVTCVVMLKG